MVGTIPEKYKSNWKNHIKNSLLLRTTLIIEQPAIHSHFLLFGPQGRLPIDITFSIESNNFQQKSFHIYVKNWQKAIYNPIVNQNINKGNNNNKDEITIIRNCAIKRFMVEI